MIMSKDLIEGKLLLELHQKLDQLNIENLSFTYSVGGSIDIRLEGFRQTNGIFDPSIGLIRFKNGKFIIETLISTATNALYTDVTVDSIKDILTYVEWKRTQSKPFTGQS